MWHSSIFCTVSRALTPHRSTSQRGYTLLEILIVLAIIALVVGIATPLIVQQFTAARGDSAKVQAAALANSVELFFLDVGRYPTAAEGLAALMSPPSGATNWKGPYVTRASSLNDPWGRPYLYTDTATGHPYEISSLGADAQAGGSGANADVNNWQ